MNGCDFKKVHPNLPNLKVEKIKNIETFSSFIGTLASPFADNFKLCPIP